ncbi:MAG TPA: protein kinase [Vicinamibacteria bacterium]|nr:protein kinase [Vicinamibacteria bacterium]
MSDEDKPAATPNDKLLTSEELFGDLVDEVGGRGPGPVRDRRGPIKVRVAEVAKKPVRATPTMAEPLPEDVAALLDAFSVPAEAADRIEPPARIPSVPAPESPPAESFLDLPPPPAGAPLEDLSPLLELPPSPDEILKTLEPPTSRKSAHFQAAPPGHRDTSEIDLGAVAAEAMTPTPGPAGSLLDPPLTGTYGPYELLERVAVGGMAEVFRAKRTGVEGFEKIVAVKRILPHLSDNQEFVDMFIAEAKMVAGLAHPNIVQIFDLGRIEKTYYIAMELVHGRDLRTILRRAKERNLRLPLDLAVHIVSKVAWALEFAHRKRDAKGRPMLIVHRDVSPQNILISFDGEVKLTDFGIAKAATKASITDVGALRGKLLYMSPEQAWGKSLDRRSDLFSLGIVFYETITEQKPFLGNSDMSILETVRECQIQSPRAVNPRVPERLENIALRALAKDPDHRYQDAGEMARELDRFLLERQPPTPAQLARLLELLFDEKERGVTIHEEPTGEKAQDLAPEADIHVEFDSDPSAPAGLAEGRAGQEGKGKDAQAIHKLLKKIGIK